MLILRQGFAFVLVGGLQLLLDWALMVALSALGMPVSAANLLGRIAGACLGFWLNGRVTFRRDGQPALSGRPLRRFLIMWISLTVVSTVAVAAVADRLGLEYAWAAKPLVEAVLAVASFWISRHWVYR
ncbi:MAG: GtrA family protein [Lysobacteraceae bacterium]